MSKNNHEEQQKHSICNKMTKSWLKVIFDVIIIVDCYRIIFQATGRSLTSIILRSAQLIAEFSLTTLNKNQFKLYNSTLHLTLIDISNFYVCSRQQIIWKISHLSLLMRRKRKIICMSLTVCSNLHTYIWF